MLISWKSSRLVFVVLQWSKLIVSIYVIHLQQEPGANATEIWNGIKYARPGDGFEPNNMQLFSKLEVNGHNEHPLFTYLKVCISTFLYNI